MSIFPIIRDIANFIWGPQILVFILGSGVYFSLRLKGIQFSQFIPAVKALSTSTRSSGDGNISPYQALMSALSGMVGNGNIAGVAT
ncbi:MAG: alanine:cation symporter family protein, partial [bacterium]